MRQRGLDALDRRNDVRTRLTLYDEDDRRRSIVGAGAAGLLGPVDNVGNIGQADRGTIAPRDNDRAIAGGGEELVVVLDRVALQRPVERTLGRIERGRGDG